MKGPTFLRRKPSAFLQRWQMANGNQIRVGQPSQPPQLSSDWDSERLCCWPRVSTARAEVLVAQAMCSVFAIATIVVASAMQVLA